MLLLSDQAGEVRERDREAREVGKEVEEGRRGVAEQVGRLLAGNGRARGGGSGVFRGMEVDIGDDTRSTTEAATTDQPRNGGNDGDVEEEDDEDDGFEQVA